MKDIVLIYEIGNPGFIICEEKFIQQITDSLKNALETKTPYYTGYNETGQIVTQFNLSSCRGFYVREHEAPREILPNDLIELQKTTLKEIIKEMKKGEEWRKDES